MGVARSILGVNSSLAFGVSAQSDNIGLYQKISYSNGVAVFDRVWSAYVPEVANEALLPGDFIYVPPGGGIGDPPPGHEVQSAPEFDSIQVMGGSTIQSDGVEDRITVVCGSQCSMFDDLIWLFMQSIQGGDGGCQSIGCGGTAVIRPTMPPPPPVPPCAISNDDLESMELTQEQLDAINHFMNGAHGQNLWNASNFGAIMEWRREWAVTFRPGIGWEQSQENWTHPCAGNFQLPGPPESIPPGSIHAHTHPFRAGEPLDLCAGFDGWQPGLTYEPIPSQHDINILIDIPGFDIGLIVDYDGITIFDETGAYESIDGQCGFERTGL
jgi:hypothetical protein